MMMPVTGVGNPSSVARKPSNVPCRPAPNISTPMPRSKGHVADIAFTRTMGGGSPRRALRRVLPDTTENVGQTLAEINGLGVLVGKILRLAAIEQEHIDDAVGHLRGVLIRQRALIGPKRIGRANYELRLGHGDREDLHDLHLGAFPVRPFPG